MCVAGAAGRALRWGFVCCLIFLLGVADSVAESVFFVFDDDFQSKKEKNVVTHLVKLGKLRVMVRRQNNDDTR